MAALLALSTSAGPMYPGHAWASPRVKHASRPSSDSEEGQARMMKAEEKRARKAARRRAEVARD